MESWAHHIPAGMLLRSRWEASRIADPDHALGLGSYGAASAFERAEPVPLERFVDYGRWFQEHALADLERWRVVRISLGSHGFRVELEDGEILYVERVVAAGIVPFAWRPPQLAELPPTLVSHTVDHRRIGAFEGRRVAVGGGGQSALESAALLAEAGAEAEVVVRAHDVCWLPDEDPGDTAEPGLHYAVMRANCKIALGSPRSAWLIAWPGLFRRLSYRIHRPLVYRFAPPTCSSAGRGRRLAD
jgi:cation diffusion facilitator CzcD-associated flavoprotein CzcO